MGHVLICKVSQLTISYLEWFSMSWGWVATYQFNFTTKSSSSPTLYIYFFFFFFIFFINNLQILPFIFLSFMESNFSIWYGQPKRQNLSSFYVPLPPPKTCLCLFHLLFVYFYLSNCFLESVGFSSFFLFYLFPSLFVMVKSTWMFQKFRLYSFLSFWWDFSIILFFDSN